MNETARHPDWLPIVEQCAAQDGSVTGLPSMEHIFGPGNWIVKPGRPRLDGTTWNGLYWDMMRECRRFSRRVGTFYLMGKRPVTAPVTADGSKCGPLAIGYDALGRKIMRTEIAASGGHEYILMAVEWETVRGVKLPRPVPVVQEVVR